jgi:cell division protein FtsW
LVNGHFGIRNALWHPEVTDLMHLSIHQTHQTTAIRVPSRPLRHSAPMTNTLARDSHVKPRATQQHTRATREGIHKISTRPDTTLLLVILALVLIGLIMVQSASQYIDPVDPGLYARRDAMWVAIGSCALVFTLCVDYHYWRRLAIPGIILAIGLLILVLRIGINVGGAQRWLAFGSIISFQPSEITKLAFILFMADWLTQKQNESLWRRLLPMCGITILIVGLVLIQNDLGTALILAVCAVTLIIMEGIPLRLLIPSLLIALSLGAWLIAATPFRRGRIMAFLHPLQCSSDASYHICQSLISLGSGGFWGRGLGDSLQKAGYLPAPFTDSVFAVIGEELGFWGTSLVLLLIGLLIWRGFRIAFRTTDPFGVLLAVGITCWLGVQAILNIGSSLAAIPFTGVPLPFISFGGSSLVISMAAIGIVLNISSHTPIQRRI